MAKAIFRNSLPFFICVFSLIYFTLLPTKALAWNADGDSFSSYPVMRDELFEAIRNAQSKVFIASFLLTDGDIASALFSARLKGLKVKVLLDQKSSKHFLSRQNYLAQNGVETHSKKLAPFEMEGLSTVLIDDDVWRLNAKLDEKWDGPVRIDRSPFTPSEMEAWFTGEAIPKPKLTQPSPADNAAILSESANTSTRVRRSRRTGSGTIAKSEQDQGDSIPRRLPRETRLQKMKSGKNWNESDGAGSKQGHIPAAPAAESDVLE